MRQNLAYHRFGQCIELDRSGTPEGASIGVAVYLDTNKVKPLSTDTDRSDDFIWLDPYEALAVGHMLVAMAKEALGE